MEKLTKFVKERSDYFVKDETTRLNKATTDMRTEMLHRFEHKYCPTILVLICIAHCVHLKYFIGF